jgi:hypothetical protein
MLQMHMMLRQHLDEVSALASDRGDWVAFAMNLQGALDDLLAHLAEHPSNWTPDSYAELILRCENALEADPRRSRV